MNLLPRPELLVCWVRDHATPGASIDPLDDGHVLVARHTADGRRFVRCLRCDTWMVVAAPEPGTTMRVEDVAELERPRRGRALRQAVVIRVIAVDRTFHALASLAVGIAALAVRWDLSGIHAWAEHTLNTLTQAANGHGGLDSHSLLAGLLTHVANLRPHSLLVLALFALGYAAISILEAIGLWLERRWAEYLTAVATAVFLPIEIRELAERVTFLRVAAFVINLAILVWIVWAKHLFGIGGPPPEPEVLELDPLPELAPARG
ncbi:MAG TPA: DUF2127 domain-containing protein [Acidimicrobiia bacterium]|jgi:uncharacterized membrane protein (DUF2068 family)